MDVISKKDPVYVPILGKEVTSRALQVPPGLLEVQFPDGKNKLIHYEEAKINELLDSLGRLLRSLYAVQSALIQKGIGFWPRLNMIFLIQLNQVK